MKKLALIKLLLGAVFLVAAPAHAEDDLLSILNSDSTDSLVKERDELTEALRRELRGATAEQNIFLTHLSANDHAKALFQWRPAFEGKAFERSATGKALKAYLLFQNNLKLNAVEALFAIQDPQNVAPEVQKVWNLTLGPDSTLWSKLKVEWTPKWTKFFNPEIQAKVVSWQVYDPTDTKRIMDLISKTKLKTTERTWLEWQMALGLALEGDSTKAGKVLAHMLQSDQTLISEDLIHMTAARLLYEKGFLSPAIAYYQKVPKKSEYWFESQEEIAWSYIRKGEPQNTLAVTQSLMTPAFSGHVGPEAVFLRALAQLKVCDYSEVIKAIGEFKNRFQPRVANLQKIKNQGETPAVAEYINRAKKGRVSPLDLKGQASHLPRYVTRDEVTYNLISQLVEFEKETEVAGQLYTRSLSEGSDKIGFQAQFEELKNQTQARTVSSRSAVINRIKNLADEEMQEIHSILQKMHIVEAEVIQQITLAERVAGDSIKTASVKVGSTGSKGKDTLSFPFEGEVWFDEIDNYKVDVAKGCQSMVQ